MSPPSLRALIQLVVDRQDPELGTYLPLLHALEARLGTLAQYTAPPPIPASAIAEAEEHMKSSDPLVRQAARQRLQQLRFMYATMTYERYAANAAMVFSEIRLLLKELQP